MEQSILLKNSNNGGVPLVIGNINRYNKGIMASENAKSVAKKVSENIRKGKKVILGEIIRDSGYSQSTSKSPTIVTETDSYKEEMKPIVEEWIKERQRITNALKVKDLSKERYESLMKALDLITKNIQLLSGKETERMVIDDGLNEEWKESIRVLVKRK